MKSLYKRVEVEGPAGFSLDYFTFCENEDCYGLEIVKSAGGKCLDAKAVKNLSDSQEEIEHIADMLSQGRVTPITLNDIVEDILYERVYQRVCVVCG